MSKFEVFEINKSIRFDDTNYFDRKDNKIKKIVISSSLMRDGNHIKRFLMNSQMDKAFHYSVLADGKIYEHISHKYYTNLYKDFRIEKETISIVIENEGWVYFNEDDKTFYNWYGASLNPDIVYKKTYRGHDFWDNYKYKVISGLAWLCKRLCIENEIEINISPNIFTMSDYKNFNGILYANNLSDLLYDINPSFDIEKFKTKVETFHAIGKIT